MALTEARYRANCKYNEKAYDKITVSLPKGTKDQIKATGESLNGFITKAVLEKLNQLTN